MQWCIQHFFVSEQVSIKISVPKSLVVNTVNKSTSDQATNTQILEMLLFALKNTLYLTKISKLKSKISFAERFAVYFSSY